MKFIQCIIIFSFFFSSCNKYEESGPTFTTIKLSEALNQFIFNKGSYWIFKNDSTGIEDSIVVKDLEKGLITTTPPKHGYGGIQNEFISISLFNTSTLEAYQDYLIANFIRRNGSGYPFTWQPIFIAGDTIDQKTNGIEIVSKFPSLELNNLTFSNLIMIKVTAADQINSVFANDTYLIFAENIGIIKIITVVGNVPIESKSIVRYNIAN